MKFKQRLQFDLNHLPMEDPSEDVAIKSNPAKEERFKVKYY